MYSPLFKAPAGLEPSRPRRDLAHGCATRRTHQYLDMLGYHVPVWFNEGLATYVEYIASSSKST